MRSERWSTLKEIDRILTKNAPGPVLLYENGCPLSYDGEGHTLFLGVSGAGKSRRGTIPATKTIIRNKEIIIAVDSKGELYKNTKNDLTEDYENHVIDFRDLYNKSAETWNPLRAPYLLWKSSNKKNKDIAAQMLEELAYAIYKDNDKADPFWIKEARQVFMACAYALFEVADEDQVNLSNVYYMIANGEERFRSSTYLKEFVDIIHNENVEMGLRSFITTANDTRGGIRSEFLDGLSIATRSEGVRRFLGTDSLNINALKADKPTIIYIIVPESNIYDDLCGVLIGQLMNHYIRLADQRYSGKLPIRANFILEELGNIGKAIINLPFVLSAGRSRNVRCMLVLQALSQLSEIYGANNATTIISNCDMKIAYRTNNWDTLTELSKLCGERVCYQDGMLVREPLITQSQLAAMDTGQALVLISGRWKFITWLQDFEDIFTISNSGKRRIDIWQTKRESQILSWRFFDIQDYVKTKRGNDPNPLNGLGMFPFCSDENSLERRFAGTDEMKFPAQKHEEIPLGFLHEIHYDKKNVIIISIGDITKTKSILKEELCIENHTLEFGLRNLPEIEYEIKDVEKNKAERLVENLDNIGTLAILCDPVPEIPI